MHYPFILFNCNLLWETIVEKKAEVITLSNLGEHFGCNCHLFACDTAAHGCIAVFLVRGLAMPEGSGLTYSSQGALVISSLCTAVGVLICCRKTTQYWDHPRRQLKEVPHLQDRP